VNIPAKKITGFFFLLLASFPLMLILLLNIQQQMIWSIMKEKLETENLLTITVAENEVVWMDKHEIWINDRMFDIHSKTIQNGVYTFTGLFDEKETLLVKKHKDSTEKSREENKLITQLFQCLQNIFLPGYQYTCFTSLKNIYSNSYFTPDPSQPFLAILTPPPESAHSES